MTLNQIKGIDFNVWLKELILNEYKVLIFQIALFLVVFTEFKYNQPLDFRWVKYVIWLNLSPMSLVYHILLVFTDSGCNQIWETGTVFCVFLVFPPGAGSGPDCRPGLHSSLWALAGGERRLASPYFTPLYVLNAPWGWWWLAGLDAAYACRLVFVVFAEKGVRVKSGSAGDTSSSSHSERSSSLGSLKGTGDITGTFLREVIAPFHTVSYPQKW